MGAQAVARDVKPMPHPAVAEVSQQLLLPAHKVSYLKEQLRMIPVLLAAAVAASLAVFPFRANTAFAILWCEIGLFAISVGLSVYRGPTGSKR